MPGTKIGGAKCRDTILKKDPNYYKKIGRIGGERCVPKGFSINRDLARKAGAKGEHISRRGKNRG